MMSPGSIPERVSMRLLCLLSSGIDSPVAAYLMGRKADLVLVHMDNRPFTDDRSLQKVETLGDRLSEVLGKTIPLYLVPHGKNQETVRRRGQDGYQCVLCKRLMLRTSEELARELDADAIVVGDSLGQVASQTLQNILCEQRGLRIPVLRPLIGVDKLEIEQMAKDIGTYEISIRKDGGCTALPSKPITMARPAAMEREEGRVDLESLVQDAVLGTVKVRG